MTQIKVSGLTEPADAELAASLGVDVVAVVFYAPSPRYVTLAQAVRIHRALPSHVRFAGIFVDTPLPIVHRLANHAGLDLVQLFGGEPRSEVEALAPRAFKAVTIRRAEELPTAVRAYVGRFGRPEARPAMMIHLAGEVAQAWSTVAEYLDRAPMLLASDALGADNAATAVTVARPWGIDIWQAVEREPGHLEPSRLERLIAAVRDADRALATATDNEPS